MTALILASGSAIRKTILANAGIPFTVIKPGVDEDIIKRQGIAARKPLKDIALDLAVAKAGAVKPKSDDLVLGSDQILEFDGDLYDKPHSLDEAKERLQLLSGKSHRLINATAILQGGNLIYNHIETPELFMRSLSQDEIDHYFNVVDNGVLSSVGAYQVEGPGIRLFDRIDGDYFAVLGLALAPLLPTLRRYQIIEF